MSELDSPNAYKASPEDVAHFRREGWLKIEDLISGNNLDRLRELVTAVNDQPSLVVAYRNPRLTNPGFLDIARLLGPLAKDLLGVEHVRIFYDRVFIRSEEDRTSPNPWHQILPRMPLDRREALTVWIPIEDVPLEKGPVTFLPRSHRLGPFGNIGLDGKENDYHDILREDDLLQVLDPVTVPLKAGGATIHDGLTLHHAGTNSSSSPRRVWSTMFIGAGTLYNGMRMEYDELGVELPIFGEFDHPYFPIVA